MADSTPRGTSIQLMSPRDGASVVFPASVRERGRAYAAGVSLAAVASAVGARLGSAGERLTLTGGHRWKAKYPNQFVDLNAVSNE